jgi:hypothetical protein
MLREAMCSKYNFPVLKADKTWNQICIRINNKGRGITFRLKQLAENLRLRLGGAAASRSETSNANSGTSSKQSK